MEYLYERSSFVNNVYFYKQFYKNILQTKIIQQKVQMSQQQLKTQQTTPIKPTVPYSSAQQLQMTQNDRWTLNQDAIDQQNLYSDDDICNIQDDDDEDENLYDSPQEEPQFISSPQQKSREPMRDDEKHKFGKDQNNMDEFFLYMIKIRQQNLNPTQNIERNLKIIQAKMKDLKELKNVINNYFLPLPFAQKIQHQTMIKNLKELNETYPIRLDQMGGKSEAREKIEKKVNFDEVICLKTFKIEEQVTVINEKQQQQQEINLVEKKPLAKYIKKNPTENNPLPYKQLKKKDIDASIISLPKYSQNSQTIVDIKYSKQQQQNVKVEIDMDTQMIIQGN